MLIITQYRLQMAPVSHLHIHAVNTMTGLYYTIPSRPQAARQGLAVLMESAVVVSKHETSTLRQSHHFISIDLTFSVGDHVREVISHTKFDSDLMSGRDAMWGQH